MRTALIALIALAAAAPATADTLIDHANGIQVGANGKLHHFTGIVIGDDGKVKRLLLKGQKRPLGIAHIIDAGGKALLPGLIDAHGHVIDLGTAAMTLQLTEANSLADLQQRLRTYAAAHRDGGWLIGFGWNQERWPGTAFPTAADLDSIVPDRPVALERVDGHALIVNSAAMAAADITAATADPSGGKIEHDASGKPTGLFVDAATALIRRAIPERTAAQQDESLARAQEQLLSVGVTAVGSMSTSLEDWAAFRRAGDHGTLQVRLISYMSAAQAAEARQKPSPWLYHDRLRLVGVKLFTDGALGSRGAWLKRPYADRPGTRGLQFHSDAELLALADQASAAGFQIATHAIGDAANAQIIGVYEKLHRKYPGDRRWRIEHAQIVDPVDIPRLAKAGIVASMQPTHQTSDRTMAEARLGPDRLAGAYAWQTIARSGARLAFGSDFPVESPNPFPGLSAAVSRQGMDGQPAGGWRPQERLSFAAALAGFTRGAAYAGFAEDRIGALDPGKWADFILVDRDPSAVDPQALGRTQVLETWVAGKRVWTSAPTTGDAPHDR